MTKLMRWIASIRYGKPVVIVSGLPRSGTSMLMQMLNAGGSELSIDDIRTADDDNPKGYYELEQVKDLEKGGDKTWLKWQKGKTVKIISFLLRELPTDLNYKVIFMQRDLDEVLISQTKMLVRLGEEPNEVDIPKIKKDFQRHLREVQYRLENKPNFEVLYVNYLNVLAQPKEEVLRIKKFLGADLNIEAMTLSVDEKLYRNRFATELGSR